MVDNGCPLSGDELEEGVEWDMDIPDLEYLYSIFEYNSTDACYAAACGGNLEILRWLRSPVGKRVLPWDSHAFTIAAECGHFDIMRWMCAPDFGDPCPLPDKIKRLDPEIAKYVRKLGIEVL